jgi:hypothetical protein
MFFEEAKRNKYLNRVKYKVCLTIENKKVMKRIYKITMTLLIQCEPPNMTRGKATTYLDHKQNLSF